MRWAMGVIAAIVIGQGPVWAQGRTRDVSESLNDRIETALKDAGNDGTIRFLIGRTARGTRIWCLAEPEALDYQTPKQRRLIVGGIDGTAASVEHALAAFDGSNSANDSSVAIACIPIANPDRWAMIPDENSVETTASPFHFPPQGDAYGNPQTVEAQYLWRFVGWFAPDVVEEIHSESAAEWQSFRNRNVPAQQAWPADCLAASVRSHPVAGIATTLSLRTVVPTHRADRNASDDDHQSSAADEGGRQGLSSPYRTGGHPPINGADRSPLRLAMQRRLDRKPQQVAEQLAEQYGQSLKSAMYQPALALVARLRLGELTGDETHRRDVERITASYVDGSKPTLPDRPSGSHLAGHLIFAELARLTGNAADVALVRRAADFGFHNDRSLREAMPFHSEMSDAVFMACPILTAAGRYTGDERYLQMAHRHLRFMQQLCLREDGLYRHSPLCEAAWGRGNGFPALGLALCLTDLKAMPASGEVTRLQTLMRESVQQHLRALAKHQDVTGMWQQVIDDPGSYRELTSSCMICFAMVRGIRSGWLDEAEFGPSARRAWEAVKTRVGEDGTLFDVCTGTGKQPSLQDYRDRTAILGRDERGGAMALMAAVEMAAWHNEQAVNLDATPPVAPVDKSSTKTAP